MCSGRRSDRSVNAVARPAARHEDRHSRGEVLRHSGAMTVGAADGSGAGSTGLLSREREWRELASQLAAAQAARRANRSGARPRGCTSGRARTRTRRHPQEHWTSLRKHARSRTQERDVLARAAERLDQQINWQATLVKQTQCELDRFCGKRQDARRRTRNAVLQTKGSRKRHPRRRRQARRTAARRTRRAGTQIKTSAAVASQAAQGQQAIVRNERNCTCANRFADRRAWRARRATRAASPRAGSQTRQRSTSRAGRVRRPDRGDWTRSLQPAQAELARLGSRAANPRETRNAQRGRACTSWNRSTIPAVLEAGSPRRRAQQLARAD